MLTIRERHAAQRILNGLASVYWQLIKRKSFHSPLMRCNRRTSSLQNIILCLFLSRNFAATTKAASIKQIKKVNSRKAPEEFYFYLHSLPATVSDTLVGLLSPLSTSHRTVNSSPHSNFQPTKPTETRSSRKHMKFHEMKYGLLWGDGRWMMTKIHFQDDVPLGAKRRDMAECCLRIFFN